MAYNRVQALLLALAANRDQAFEDVVWSILAKLSDATFATITGDLLDKVGARVGEKRLGRSDADYQAAVRIRVRVNRSRGKAEDIIAVAKLAALNSTPLYSEPNDTTPVFEVDIENLPGAAAVAKVLGQAKPVGVRGLLAFTIDASDGLTWGDATDPTNTDTRMQWADAVGGTGPGWPSGVNLKA